MTIPDRLPPSPSLDPSLIGANLDEKLAELTEKFDVDPNIAAAYSSESQALHSYPGMEEYDGLILTLRDISLSRFEAQYQHTYEQDLTHVASDASRADRRQAKFASSAAYRSHKPTAVLKAIQETPTGQDELDDVFKGANMGLANSVLAEAMATANGVHYSLERIVQGPRPIDNGDHDFWIRLVYNSDEDMSSATERDLSQRLRESGFIDLSEGMLNERFEQFCAVAQFETSILFMADLQNLADLGSEHRRARTLAQRFRMDLTSDNYERKIEMSQQLASAFRGSAIKERDPAVRELLLAFTARWNSIATSLLAWRSNFAPVYQNLGYPLPPELQPKEPETVALEQPKLSIQELRNYASETSATNPALVAEVSKWSAILDANARTFAQAWRLSNEQRREAGFTKMQGELMRGFSDSLDTLLLPSMSKQDARQIIDLLFSLNRQVQANPTDARQIIEQAIAQQRLLQEESWLVGSVAAESGIPFSSPNIVRLAEHIAMFQEDWTTYRQLIVETWPHYEGKQVVERLEGLFFDTAAAHIDDPATESAMEAQEAIAELLDRIILPPGSSKSDLERELRRIGAGAAGVTKVEWQRISDLASIANRFNGTLFRSKDRSLGSAPPYFVAVIEMGGDIFAIADSPIFGNATYVVAEKLTPGTWLEVLELSKTDARSVGAHKIIHSKKPNDTESHVDKVINKVFDLHTVQV